MAYSFKQTRAKSLFKKDTKFWLAFLTISVGVLITLQVALSIQLKNLSDNTKDTKREKDDLIKRTTDVKDEFTVLRERVIYANKIIASNATLKESLHNLFEIVPDKIVLNKIEITPTTLTIFGTTPSRDIFNLQFAPALKSIFTKSETSFLRGENGNSRFISINQIELKEETEATEEAAATEPPKEAHTPEHNKPKEEKKGH